MKTWTAEEIKALLIKNNEFVAKAVVKIYERQTADEQAVDATSNLNGIGFNGVDAFIMSKFAKFYLKNGYLSEKQLVYARKKIMKYVKQLTAIANEKIGSEAIATVPAEKVIEVTIGFEYGKNQLMTMETEKFATYKDAVEWSTALLKDKSKGYDLARFTHAKGHEALQAAVDAYHNVQDAKKQLLLEM